MFVIIIFNEILESKVFFLKRFSCSVRDFSHDLSNEEVQVLKIDLSFYSILQTAYHPSYLKSQGIPFSFQHFQEKELKFRQGTSEHSVRSMKRQK